MAGLKPSRESVEMVLGRVVDDRYHVEELLGEGAMGAVYRATQEGGPDVAIKILPEDVEGQSEAKERFEREARALFGLNHPNLLEVHDFGVEGQRPYLVMELLVGSPLDDLVERDPPSPGDALDMAIDMLRGLAFAHSQGVLHRDLKTSNVFVVKSASPGAGLTKVLDFGLVKFVDDERWGEDHRKLTVQGRVFGTPAYMAPEQCNGDEATAPTDVYAAGVVLFELFTGVWPFMYETRMEMFRGHLLEKPPTLAQVRPEIRPPPELEAVIARALEKEPSARFADANEMLAALLTVPRAGLWASRRAAAAGPASRPPARGAAPPTTASTTAVVALVGGLVGLALAALLGWLLFG